MPKDRVETAQLQREIVGVAVHDLGSVAAALVMRAALPPAAALEQAEREKAERHQAALASLADQVRAAMQLLDVARFSPDAPPQSVSAPLVPLATWLQRWPALGRTLLPRGVRLRVEAVDRVADMTFRLSLQADIVATPVLLCALHALHATRDVTLHVAIRADHYMPPALVCTMRTASRVRRRSKWQRYAAHLMSTVDWPLTWWEEDEGGGQVLRLTVPLVEALPQESA